MLGKLRSGSMEQCRCVNRAFLDPGPFVVDDKLRGTSFLEVVQVDRVEASLKCDESPDLSEAVETVVVHDEFRTDVQPASVVRTDGKGVQTVSGNSKVARKS